MKTLTTPKSVLFKVLYIIEFCSVYIFIYIIHLFNNTRAYYYMVYQYLARQPSYSVMYLVFNIYSS